MTQQEQTTIYDKLVGIAELRNKLQQCSSELKQRKEEFNEINKDIIEERKSLQLELEQREINLKVGAVLEADSETIKNNKFVNIRHTKRISYEYINAMRWATKHKLCLMLDAQQFENLVRTSDISAYPDNELGFVTITTMAQATIARDLSPLLDKS